MTTILIVDDEPTNQRILDYTLRKAGYETLTTSNGEEALSLLATSEIDLAILDMVMPVMDGITLLKHIRADAKFSQLPVIFITGSSDDIERIQVERESIQGFLSKPASSKTVIETVQAALEKK
jgi:two-component system alkaline phosphatase synthesis response regulator PhoP